MRCDQCDNEATVHEVTVVGNQKVEKHLCESCAQSEGLTTQPTEPINALLSKFIMAPGLVQQAVTGGNKPKGENKAPECPECSMTWMQFRKSGLLGCATCYETFESRLAPLIERAQEGATHHVGKAPRGSAGLADHQRTLRALRADQELTLEQLARLTGISAPALSLIETGKRDAEGGYRAAIFIPGEQGP